MANFHDFWPLPPLCVQMDFTRTFEANSKCNNINYVWSHFYQILVVLKYHRRLCNNIFDTDIFRCIKTPTLKLYIWHFLGYLCSYKCLCQRYWLIGTVVLQNNQNIIEMTSNVIYIVAFVGGLKCLCIIHLTTHTTYP